MYVNRICLFGEDVTNSDFEILRDIIRVMIWATNSSHFEFADSYYNCNFGIYVINSPNIPFGEELWDTFQVDEPSGQYAYWPNDGNTQLVLIRVSNQGDNRHTLTHEFGHAMGLDHIPISGSSMSAAGTQLLYWLASDIDTVFFKTLFC